MPKNLLLVSSSRFNHGAYLAHALTQLESVLEGVKEVTFIPYARPGGMSFETYTEAVREPFKKLGKQLVGIHQHTNPQEAVIQAEAVFTGGGNTFLLVHDLYLHALVVPLRKRASGGMPYIGTSAGSNIAGLTMHTTNDMPIIYPPSFETLGLIPFNINPHFVPGKALPTHMGETREDRIHEFHAQTQNKQPVLGIREDGLLRLAKGQLALHGIQPATLFTQGQPDRKILPGETLQFLMKSKH